MNTGDTRSALQVQEDMRHAVSWARTYVSPLSFTACGHARHDRNLAGHSTCRDCGHRWTEHPIDIHDDVYDTLMGYMARRLDNK